MKKKTTKMNSAGFFTLHCPKDKNLLSKVDIKVAEIIITGEKLDFPRYKCPKCQKWFTSINRFHDLETIRFEGETYVNLLKSIDEKRYNNYLKTLNNLHTQISCYIYVHKPKYCRVCKSHWFITRSRSYLEGYGNTKKYDFLLCNKCQSIYVKYEKYVKYKDQWVAINQSEIPMLDEELKEKNKRKEQREKKRKEEKQDLRLAKKQDKLLGIEQVGSTLKKTTDNEQKHNKKVTRIKAAEQNNIIAKNSKEERAHLNSRDEDKQLVPFLIRRSVFKCAHNNHKLVNIEGTVNVIDASGIVHSRNVAAGYCSECNKYFIMESTFRNLRFFGVPLCRIYEEKHYLSGENTNNKMNLASESILKQFGYSVSQAEGLSINTRQMILSLLIDNGIMTKSEIISYLDFFINQRKGQPKYEIAIEKWHEDLDFIRHYKSGYYKHYKIGLVINTAYNN